MGDSRNLFVRSGSDLLEEYTPNISQVDIGCNDPVNRYLLDHLSQIIRFLPFAAQPQLRLQTGTASLCNVAHTSQAMLMVVEMFSVLDCYP